MMKRLTWRLAVLAGLVLGLLTITGLVIRAQAMGQSERNQTPHAATRLAAVATQGPSQRVRGTSTPARTRGIIAVRTASPTPTGDPTALPTAADALVIAQASPTPFPTAADTPVMAQASPMPTPAQSGSAWITLGAYTVEPGGIWTLPLHGAGFTPGERIDLTVEGAANMGHAPLMADGSGTVNGTVVLEVMPNADSAAEVVAVGSQSRLQASATLGVIPLVATLSLSPYAALPGSPIDVSGQGYASGEPVDLALGGKVVRRVHADGGGNLQLPSAFSVPYDAAAGPLVVATTGTLSHHGASQTLNVEALQPWATASSYTAHPGDHIQFEAHGFAVGEPLAVYAGNTMVTQSNGPTDGQGNAGGLGPVTVPTGDPQVLYTLLGRRSGARLSVTITVLQ